MISSIGSGSSGDRKWSNYQLAIFDWVRNGSGHGIVNAVAGSGKSTVLEESVKGCIPERNPITFDYTRILMMAFNKHIEVAMTPRMPRYVETRTFNAFGWRICRYNVPKVELKANKNSMYFMSVIPPDHDRPKYSRLRQPVLKMVGLLKALNEPNIDNWQAHSRLYGVEMGDVKPSDNYEDVLRQVYNWSINEVAIMDFDDQVFQVVHRGWQIPQYEWVKIDEVQDASPVQIEMSLRLAEKGRLLMVGDPDQCQPPGSMVTVATRSGALEERPIEAVRKWDSVVSLVPGTREWRINPVLETAARPYNGELIVVKTADGLTSRYTPSHRCIADFSALRHQWCVYLMARGDRFRVGVSAMAREASGNASYGLAARMRQEGADCGWILSLHGTAQEAWVAEQVATGRFGIPQTRFKVGNMSQVVQPQLNEIWDAIGDNTALAEQALLAHGRLLEFPLIEDPHLKSHALKRLMKVRACNLVTGCNLVTLDWRPRQKHEGHHNRAGYKDYRQVTVTREHYEGNVYSLRVARDESYVSDGLATSNSVYLFRGAHPDAMGELTRSLGAVELPLSVCYRCSDAIIECANEEVPRMEAPAPNANGEGSVEWCSTEDFLRQATDDEMVLCRMTAPLIKRCLQMLNMGKKAYVKGRDLVDQIIMLVEQVHGDPDFLQRQVRDYKFTRRLPRDDIQEFLDKLATYRADQMKRLEAQARDAEAQALEDRIEGIMNFANNSRFVGEIIMKVEEITSDESQEGVAFMTGHKCKGLEAKKGKKVWLLRPDLCPHSRAKSDIQLRQERNLRYVMKTRGREDLRFVEKERDEK